MISRSAGIPALGLGRTTMATGSNLLSLVSACFLVASSLQSTLPASPLLGVSPQDEMYYTASADIACKDRSKSFSRDRLNDGFCDCVDGTDEPGTSACPDGRFYCRNVGSKSQFLFSSRVNDGFCDCCDGSDEYDGRTNCLNTCNGNGYVVEKDIDNLTGTNSDSISSQEKKIHSNLKDLIQKLKELKTLLMMEVVLLGCVIAYGLFYRRVRSRRRRQ